MGVIYKIISPSGKIYVGKTYNLRKRISSHKCSAKADKNIMLHNSIRKYGWDAHNLEVIEEVDDSIMDEREIFWIAELKTYCYDNCNGLNMTKGGDGQRSTWMHKTDLREKQSKRYSGEGNPFYGKNHTDDFKNRRSKEVSEYNKINGIKIPEWGVNKGRMIVMKPVLLYDTYGVFVKEFESYTQAGIFIGVKPSRVSESALGRKTHCNGYHFRDKTENHPFRIDISFVKSQTVKRPIYLLNDDFEIITEFPSAKEVSGFFSLPTATISRSALGNPIRSGHIFIYKDLYKIIMQEAA